MAVTIVQRLVKQRRRLGLTQVMLAEKMSISQTTVSEFESGACSPTLKTLERYAKAVGMKLSVVPEDETCTGED